MPFHQFEDFPPFTPNCLSIFTLIALWYRIVLFFMSLLIWLIILAAFSNIESNLYSWDKSYLVMICYPFSYIVQFKS